MRWLGWFLLGAGACLATVLLIRGDPSAEVQRLRDRVAADSVRSLATDSVIAERERRLAERNAEADSMRRVLARQAGVAADLDRAHAEARQAAARARSALDSARTLADTVRGLVVALGAETARAEAAEASLAATRDQLATTAALLATAEGRASDSDSSLREMTADRDRLRGDLSEAMGTIDRLTGRKTGFIPRLGRAAETVAIGATTVDACQDGVVSIGCIAGVVVTAARIL